VVVSRIVGSGTDVSVTAAVSGAIVVVVVTVDLGIFVVISACASAALVVVVVFLLFLLFFFFEAFVVLVSAASEDEVAIVTAGGSVKVSVSGSVVITSSEEGAYDIDFVISTPPQPVSAAQAKYTAASIAAALLNVLFFMFLFILISPHIIYIPNVC
jgi:hypothetical protein